MYFSRVRLVSQGLDHQRLIQNLSESAYAEHRLLWRLFPDDPEADRDFLFRRDSLPEQGLFHSPVRPLFYMVSRRQPVAIPGLLRVESKEYRPTLSAGDRLAFGLRVNPVVTRDGKRHDVVIDARKRIEREGGEMENKAALVAEHGLAWLEKRAEKHGFAVSASSTRVEGYLQHRLPTSERKGQHIRFSTLDYVGVLTVTDPERFAHALFTGIGPAKAFGCGMLLVKRA